MKDQIRGNSKKRKRNFMDGAEQHLQACYIIHMMGREIGREREWASKYGASRPCHGDLGF